jgi:hypothetical protein
LKTWLVVPVVPPKFVVVGWEVVKVEVWRFWVGVNVEVEVEGIGVNVGGLLVVLVGEKVDVVEEVKPVDGVGTGMLVNVCVGIDVGWVEAVWETEFVVVPKPDKPLVAVVPFVVVVVVDVVV